MGGPFVECEVLPGLEAVAEDELVAAGLGPVTDRAEGVVVIDERTLRPSLALSVAVATHLGEHFDVPRPKALLGDQHQRRLLGLVDRALGLHPAGTFTSFRLGAAGAESSVFARVADAIAEATGLRRDQDDGDLLVRVRRAGEGWDVLVRTTPRPLAARAWRVAHLPYGLNATIAAAMVRLTEPAPSDRVLNLMCGSGTLLIERAAAGPAASLTGVDVDAEVALGAARANLAAAEVAATLVEEDATALSLPDASADVLLADLPYGHRSGTHDDNERLHPLLLAEAARVAAPGARFAVVTHELRRFRAAVADATDWRIVSETQVFQKGHHPTIWLLHRT